MEWYCRDCQQEVDFESVGGGERLCPFCGRALETTVSAGPAATQPPPAPQVVLPRAIGRYRVCGTLGAGGLADVYEGEDEELKRAVAIKVMHAHLLRSAHNIELFLQEARTLASLDHPGIIPIYDAGRTPEGLCYLVMKLFRGSDLRERMKQGRLPREEAVDLVAQAAEALAYAHQNGLVHRDIKPNNLLLDSTGRMVVADFGLALREENYGTGPAFVGTVPYMSPEQARHEGHRVDARTDVYSLGVVLYELLTGRRPFTGATEDELLENIRSAPLVPPRQLDDTVPRELDRICVKALARRASDRYDTAQAFADDVRAWQKAMREGRSRILQADSSSVSHLSGMSAATSAVVPHGLRPFTEEDASFFLRLVPGPRDREGLPETVAFWKSRLESVHAERAFGVGVLYGPPGCGKTSLVRAGLIPRLGASVAAVFLDASSGDIEAELRRQLSIRFPALSPDVSLAGALEHLRRGSETEHRKVVIILDQFENWLHGRGDTEQAELTQALRQCDGTRVQCVLLVRDEFWIPLGRFLRAVEVRLEDGVNAQLMDLFDPLHARKVLTEYGRAYNRLPREGEPSIEGKQFLDAAIEALTESGKIAPVRLNLFAEVMKGKVWVPGTLKELGAQGVGEAFLEAAFGAAAPTAHRVRARAAEAVLLALLPPAGVKLQRFTRRREDLVAAARYEQKPEAFLDLMRILEQELRLVSPTALAGVPLPGEGELSSSYYRLKPGESGSYQLAHDFFVPVLRNWLTRKQRETYRGRATLALARCTEWWQARSEDRQLPAPLEWVSIRVFTRPSQWTEPQRRMMRRADRYYLARTLIAALVLLGAGGLGAFLVHLDARRRERQRAAELVAHIRTVHDTQWLRISEELRRYRRWAKPLLHEVLVDPEASDSERLHARMGLLALDPEERTRLQDLLLESGPDDFREILVVLKPLREEVVPDLWHVAEDSKAASGHRFRAAAALADLDPDRVRWGRLAPFVARELTNHDAFFLRSWMPTLRPVRQQLVGPLAESFAGETSPDRSALEAEALAAYAADQPAVLADLLLAASPASFRVLWPAAAAHPEKIGAVMEQAVREPQGDADRERWAHRRVRAAVALLRLQRMELVWPLFRHEPDPRVRSHLIHALAPSGVDPRTLLARLPVERDVSARRALLLALGEYSTESVPSQPREALLKQLQENRQAEPDAGLRAAGEWLLRRWGHASAAKETPVAPERASWYVNGQGQTMVRITPDVFQMGSPMNEVGRLPDETRHRCRIPRRYALGDRPVTVEQFARFLKDPRDARLHLYSHDREGPAIGVNWFVAAQYCRWLSERENIPEDQMCYPPVEQIKPGMTVPADYLGRRGYRLPTEAEWEYACRAGAVTSRYFGESEELLGDYAWYVKNAEDHAWPAGLKKPNDLGLFSMHGNVWTWCQDRYAPYGEEGVTTDSEDARRVVSAEEQRVLRAGAFTRRGVLLRAALRYPRVPTYEYLNVGLRLARTEP